jgi:hypothetical protein
MDDKTVSERIHDGTMNVRVVQRDEGPGQRFAIAYGGARMMNLGDRRSTFTSAREAQQAADLAVELTGHRCYWACTNWS